MQRREHLAMTDGPPSPIRADASGVIVDVVVVPRASKCAIVGVHDGRLKVTLDAPPVDGQANDAIIAFLAKLLGRPKRDVTIVRGEKGRKKTLVVRGVSVGQLTALLPGSVHPGV